MKKTIALVLILAALFTLCACGETIPKPPQAGSASDGAENSTASTGNSKTNNAQQHTAGDGAAWEVGSPESRHYTVELTAGPKTYYQLGVPVKNTGSVDLYLNYMAYDLKYSDGTSEYLQNPEPFPKLIHPGETAWFMLDSLSLDPGKTVEEVSIRNVFAEAAKMRCLRLPVTNVTFNEDWELYATGTVENNTSETTGIIHVGIYLYDANGAFLGRLIALAGALEPGATSEFKASTLGYPSYLHPSDIASYEVYAGEFSLTNGDA